MSICLIALLTTPHKNLINYQLKSIQTQIMIPLKRNNSLLPKYHPKFPQATIFGRKRDKTLLWRHYLCKIKWTNKTQILLFWRRHFIFIIKKLKFFINHKAWLKSLLIPKVNQRNFKTIYLKNAMTLDLFAAAHLFVFVANSILEQQIPPRTPKIIMIQAMIAIIMGIQIMKIRNHNKKKEYHSKSIAMYHLFPPLNQLTLKCQSMFPKSNWSQTIKTNGFKADKVALLSATETIY